MEGDDTIGCGVKKALNSLILYLFDLNLKGFVDNYRRGTACSLNPQYLFVSPIVSMSDFSFSHRTRRHQQFNKQAKYKVTTARGSSVEFEGVLLQVGLQVHFR